MYAWVGEQNELGSSHVAYQCNGWTCTNVVLFPTNKLYQSMASLDVDGQSAYRSRYSETLFKSIKWLLKDRDQLYPNPLGVVQDHLLLFKRRIAFSSDPRAEDFLTQTSFSQDKSHAEAPVCGAWTDAQETRKQTRNNREEIRGAPRRIRPSCWGRSIKPEGGHLSPFGTA